MNQQNSGSNQGPKNNDNANNPNQRRHNNNRRRHHNGPRPQGDRPQAGQQGERPQGDRQKQPQNAQGGAQGPRREQNQGQGGNNQNRRRRRPGQGQGQQRDSGPRPQHQGPREPHSGGFNLDRVYEKYLNLLDQHLIARRKYHDLFYRADPAQKNKLERNFYNTLNDIREFENRLAPDVRDLFEKRNNGLQPDRTYTSNRDMPVEGDEVPADLPPADPHYLQSQRQASYKDDVEESVGTPEDYLRYKNLL